MLNFGKDRYVVIEQEKSNKMPFPVEVRALCVSDSHELANKFLQERYQQVCKNNDTIAAQIGTGYFRIQTKDYVLRTTVAIVPDLYDEK